MKKHTRNKFAKYRSYTLGFTLCCLFLLMFWIRCSTTPEKENKDGLKDVFLNKFLIGTAMDTAQLAGKDTLAVKIIKKHFNALVAEDCMKAENIHPEKDRFDFSIPDQFVDFGKKNNMSVTGHTLIWHSQLPDWFFVDEEGNDVSRDELIARMKNHIHTIVGRYKGKITGWDVVNEAVMNDGTLRPSKFLQIIGEDYIKMAFQFAHEADPAAELYYNDYSMTIEAKQDGVMKLIRSLQEENIPVNGIGMQGHINLDGPDVPTFEKSILRLSELNIPILITELDITVLPWPDKEASADVSMSHEFQQKWDPYAAGLPDSINSSLNKKYKELFEVFTKHQALIKRVTLWGVTDKQSWRNDWPIKGRTDYPLLFDRSYQPKQVVKDLLNKKY